MAEPTYNPQLDAPATERRTLLAGYLFGVPVKDLGLIATGIIGVASGFAAFFLATFVGIISILLYNAGGHTADYAISYKFVGLPAGVAVAALVLAYLGMLWIRRITRR